ncbi:alpha/beta-hydrolase [Dendrothele bispora CBS 962.96]|uniref:Alpha/beta-hydrolase n=1 Tax=Dendrothele bispora (strain CBS 962.96) TaxID=1314807 RepID=A0A4S8MT63_DENBC|nr:alpha/beta-hydrolase [Dendrothele bispora CBS 962.96]
MNPLTRNVGLRVGPLVLDTLVKHYFQRAKERIQNSTKELTVKEDGKEDDPSTLVQLRQDELLYDEAFNIIKVHSLPIWQLFMFYETFRHTVEELQNFSNTRTPSPPWVHVIRLLVPMSCCDEAAGYLVKALGGEDVARKVVGGVKWWQVRAVSGVDAEWITAKKDWQEAKRRYKMQEKMKEKGGKRPNAVENNLNDELKQDYEQDMDMMRCILYCHGGGYYFGSIDQERYSIQRYARKINGRVFAISYRLAPQYPFPCAIQDALAAYLYLIRPPPGARHKPVKPGHIVVAGDSAGGGLTLALLQVLRDSGLPLPAGGVLISPWCDLTHSFPSVHTNTATDIIPQYGLSLHKPSSLWPPPSHEETARIQTNLRTRIHQTLNKMHDHKDESLNRHSLQQASSVVNASFSIIPTPTESMMPVDVGATTPFPSADPNTADEQNFVENDQKVSLTAQNGEVLTIDQQVQFYTVNNLVTHPLVSPAMSYLGGLPPLFFIASNKEVLRDEIIYTAHKAAYPEKFPIKENAKVMYPALNGIENRYGPTPVHLQVYDDTAHVLPVLFAFTTPAKYCFRAMASFCKYTTGMPLNTQHSSNSTGSISTTDSMDGTGTKILKGVKSKSSLRGSSIFASSLRSSPERKKAATTNSKGLGDEDITLSPPRQQQQQQQQNQKGRGLKRSFSENVRIMNPFSGDVTRKASLSAAATKSSKSSPAVHLQDVPPVPPIPNLGPSTPISSSISTAPPSARQPRFAGDPVVYSETAEFPSMKTRMIRERVSTRGIIRSLEPEEELDAMKVPQEVIGDLSELAIRRYIEGKSKYDKKFASTMKGIEKQRRRNLEKAKKDTVRNMNVLQHSLDREVQQQQQQRQQDGRKPKRIKDGLLASSGWIWAWALDENERPPPSSIVSRRDTSEALRLARVADIQEDGGAMNMSGNHLWEVVNNFLTFGPGGGGGGNSGGGSGSSGKDRRDGDGRDGRNKANEEKELEDGEKGEK